MIVTDNTLIDIERSIATMNEERAGLIAEKQAIELKLAALTAKVRTANGFLPNDEYRKICGDQLDLKNEKLGIERKIGDLKNRIAKRHEMKDEVKNHMKRNGLNPAGATKENLIQLRDKYMAFSSDTTRISSMRAMASQIAEELELIVKTL